MLKPLCLGRPLPAASPSDGTPAAREPDLALLHASPGLSHTFLDITRSSGCFDLSTFDNSQPSVRTVASEKGLYLCRGYAIHRFYQGRSIWDGVIPSVVEGSMTEVEPVLDFASSGRTGRRNALPDILGSPAGVTPTDLPLKLAEMSINSGIYHPDRYLASRGNTTINNASSHTNEPSYLHTCLLKTLSYFPFRAKVAQECRDGEVIFLKSRSPQFLEL
ncbi:hypothetical protein lerEdw1_009938 [Lerista edwardsae]|nr:hypothetical protein lerEdw1_009938 [Lerista edwardsae]